MEVKVKISTYFQNANSLQKQDFKTLEFSNWESIKKFLLDEISLKNDHEVFAVEILDQKFVEINSNRFSSLKNIEIIFQEFIKSIQKNEKKNSRTNGERIEIRISKLDKQAILDKVDHLGVNISEYTRLFYKYGEVIVLDNQFKKDVRGMAINLNQIAKRVNAGISSGETVISELTEILEELKNLVNKSI